MREWYGVRVVEQYGETPPDDWRRIVDSTDNEAVKRGLSIIRSRYFDHPPTFPQFEQAMRPATMVSQGPSPGDLLCAYVMKTYGARLTPKQIREPWTYFHSNNGPEISGVWIPADGESASVRVTMLDMQSGQQELAT
jgi:hypothetical protein